MGRRRYAGLVSEVVQYGKPMGRLDIPEIGDVPAQTIFFGGESVYQLSPVSEEAARAVCQHSRPTPVHPYELTPPTRAISAPTYWCARCGQSQVDEDGQICDPCAADVEEDVHGRDEDDDDFDSRDADVADDNPNEYLPSDPFEGAIEDAR